MTPVGSLDKLPRVSRVLPAGTCWGRLNEKEDEDADAEEKVAKRIGQISGSRALMLPATSFTLSWLYVQVGIMFKNKRKSPFPFSLHPFLSAGPLFLPSPFWLDLSFRLSPSEQKHQKGLRWGDLNDGWAGDNGLVSDDGVATSEHNVGLTSHGCLAGVGLGHDNGVATVGSGSRGEDGASHGDEGGVELGLAVGSLDADTGCERESDGVSDFDGV